MHAMPYEHPCSSAQSMLAFAERHASSSISFARTSVIAEQLHECISHRDAADLAECVLAAATLAFISSARRFSRAAFSACKSRCSTQRLIDLGMPCLTSWLPEIKCRSLQSSLKVSKLYCVLVLPKLFSHMAQCRAR